MADPAAALTYAKDVYDAEMTWHRSYEEKVLRYQSVAGTVLGAGALGLSQVQFALRHIASTGIGMTFLAVVAISGICAAWTIITTLRAMAPHDVLRPPVDQGTLQHVAAATPGEVMKLAVGFGMASEAIRQLNLDRGALLRQGWNAAFGAVGAGLVAFVLALFIDWPPKP